MSIALALGGAVGPQWVLMGSRTQQLASRVFSRVSSRATSRLSTCVSSRTRATSAVLIAGVVASIGATGIAPPANARGRDLPERRVLVRDRDEGSLPTLRLDRAALRAAPRTGEKFRVPRVAIRRDLEVELELERFVVTRVDTRFVIGRRGRPDRILDFDPSQVSLLRGRVVGRPGSRVVLALRDGHHAGQIDLGPGAPRFWVSSRGRDGRVLSDGRASIFEAVGWW